MSHSPTKKIWAGALSALLALFAALVVATPAYAAAGDGGELVLGETDLTDQTTCEKYFGSGATYDAATNTVKITGTVDLSAAVQITGTGSLIIEADSSATLELTTSVAYVGGSSAVNNNGTLSVGANATVTIGENVTVQDASSTGSARKTVTVVAKQGGTVIVADGGTVINTSTSTSGNDSAAILAVGGTVEVKENGTVGDATTKVGIRTNGAVDIPSNIIISGGTVTGSVAGMYLPQDVDMTPGSNTVTISDGSVTGPVGIVNLGSSVTVEGTGEVSSTNSAFSGNIGSGDVPMTGVTAGILSYAGSDSANEYGTNSQVNIDGGTVDSVVTKKGSNNGGHAAEAAPPVTVDGGTVSGDITVGDGGTVNVESGSVGGKISAGDGASNVIVNQTGGKIGEIDSSISTFNQQGGSVTTNDVQAVNTVTITYVNGDTQTVSGPATPGMTESAQSLAAISKASQAIQQAKIPGAIYYTKAPAWTGSGNAPAWFKDGGLAGYGQAVAAIKNVTLDFNGNSPMPDAATANAAMNTAMGTKDVNYVGDVDNVMWAVIEGTPNTWASVSFSYTDANGKPAVVFANVGEPTTAQNEIPPAGAVVGGGGTEVAPANFIPINSNGKAVVWFQMDSDGNPAPSVTPYVEPANAAQGITTPKNPAYGQGYQETEPVAAVYTATAWPSGYYKTLGTTDSSEVGVNGIDYYYTDKTTGKDIAFPGIGVQWAKSGNSVILSDGTPNPQPTYGTVTQWTVNGGTYGINTPFELPAPSGYEPLPAVATFGVTVQLNLSVNTEMDIQFPTGDGIQFVNAQGDTWPGTTTADEGQQSLLLGTDSNRTLPTLPGVKGWEGAINTTAGSGGPNTSISGLFKANNAAAFIGWYSWDETNGYTLYESGMQAPEYGTLQLYPLFAPVTVSWSNAQASTGSVPSTYGNNGSYSYVAWTAPGLTQSFTLSVGTDASGLAAVLGVDQIATSQAASQLLQTLVTNDVTSATGATVTDGYAGTISNHANMWFNNQFEATLNPSTGAETVVGPLNGATFTQSATDPLTVSVYVPAGMQAYGWGGLRANLPSISTDSTPGTTGGSGTLATRVNPINVSKVTVEVQPPTSGTVHLQPATGEGQSGMVELTAVPATGYTFDHWSILGGATPEGIDMNSITIVVPDGSGTWVANFVAGSSSTVDVVRLYNPNTGEHLYTTDANEVDVLENDYGWDNENVAWIAPANSATPIYRLYNPNNGDHLYTVSLDEYNTLQQPSIGWVGEGIKLYSAPTTGAPIYRLYNPFMTANAGAYAHLWTGDYNEYVTLWQRDHWNPEGVAFYAISVPNPS